MKSFVFLLISMILFVPAFSQSNIKFDIQGHRGCRGLMPENSIPGFLKAIELGVDTLELDTVVSRDSKIVASHEPFFSADISLDKTGQPIPFEKQTEFNMFKMNYAEIKLFDVGSIGHKRFPEQEKMKVAKPLLSDIFKETQKYISKNKLKNVMYNIETKSTPKGDDTFHPKPAIFAKLLYNEILKNKMQKFVTIQSFDVRTLQEFKKFKIKLPMVFLVENKDGIEKNIERLGFQPDIYSPHFSLLSQDLVDYCHSKHMKIIPWTVNEIADMEKIKPLNVDGIISDYPNRAIQVFRK
jgi:glycerophosphoryl diester phosphodiesterase